MSGRAAQDPSARIRTGIAGEFLVAGELSKRGWIATLTAKNTPHVDVLAARPTGDVHARIQIKTRSPAYSYAHRVGERFAMDGERDFVVLVDLGEEIEAPRYWVIPASEANRLITNQQLRTKDVRSTKIAGICSTNNGDVAPHARAASCSRSARGGGAEGRGREFSTANLSW